MRRAAKVDDNHSEIVNALRAVGCTVQSMAAVGKGVPDLLVGKPEGENILMEVKDGAKPPSARSLTPDQQRWHAAWNGHVYVVNNITEALAAVGVSIQGGGQ